MKKAQGLSLGYVVVGIIAVVVLVVIILIFTGGMRNITNNTDNIVDQKCESNPLCRWTLKSECNAGDEKIAKGIFTDIQVGKVCCCKIAGEPSSLGTDSGNPGEVFTEG